MKTLEKVARRLPWLRYCILQYRRQERQRQAKVRWEYRRTVFSVLGQTLTTWAMIESIIDHIVVWYHPIGSQTIQPDLPVTFDPKMDYLNKMARDPGFSDGGQFLRWVRTESKRLNKARKAIVHGVAWHIHPQGLDWRLQLRNFDGPNTTVETYDFKLEDLTKILSQMSEFLSKLSPHATQLTGLKAAKAKANNSSANSG